jgi:hypothetical protein
VVLEWSLTTWTARLAQRDIERVCAPCEAGLLGHWHGPRPEDHGVSSLASRGHLVQGRGGD